MRKLNDIATECGTDKMEMMHNYVELYEKIFENIRERNIKLLEIGIYRGESLKMWKEYFPNGQIYGIDIDPKTMFEDSRITTRVGHQANKKFMEDFSDEFGPFDIIIDDGGHVSKFQIESFKIMFPLLKSKGTYIIEDLHTSYWQHLTPRNQQSCVSFLKELVENINNKGALYNGSRDINHFIKNKIPMDFYEENIESILFSKSICVVNKR